MRQTDRQTDGWTNGHNYDSNSVHLMMCAKSYNNREISA